MNRLLLLCSALLLLTAGCGDHEGPDQPAKAVKLKADKIDPQVSRYYKVKGKAGEVASVVAIGDGATYMGVYVYDKYGNCVAWDDEGSLRTRDDLAVEWLMRDDGSNYSIEVRNNGSVANECQVTVWQSKGRTEK